MHQIKGNGWCEWVTRVWDRVGSTNSRFRPAQTQHWQWCFCADISYLAHKLLNTSVPSPSDHDAKPTPWEETTKVCVTMAAPKALLSPQCHVWKLQPHAVTWTCSEVTCSGKQSWVFLPLHLSQRLLAQNRCQVHWCDTWVNCDEPSPAPSFLLPQPGNLYPATFRIIFIQD